MAGFGDRIGDWLGDAVGGVLNPPEYDDPDTATTPVAPATGAPAATGAFQPLGGLLSWGIANQPNLTPEQRADIISRLRGSKAEAVARLSIWKDRLAEAIRVGGSSSQSGLPDGTYADPTSGTYVWAGQPVDELDYLSNMEMWKEMNPSSGSKKSQDVLNAEAAVSQLNNYLTNINNVLPKEEEPKEVKAKAPVKLTIDQLVAAVGGQESSARPPSWASATRTQGFGPADNNLDGPYTDEAGNYYPHFNKGFDFGLTAGTPIETTVGGTVIAAGNQGDGWGNSVKIRDADGNIHNYGHMGNILVNVGDVVGPSTSIGDVGAPGAAGEASDGPHLSYDVKKANGYFMDPTPFLIGVNLGAENPSGAKGTFQILESNWPSWVVEAGLPAGTPRTAESEYAVAKFKLGQYLAKTGGDPRKAVMMWYAGEGVLDWTEDQINKPQYGPDGQEYPSVGAYADQILARLEKGALNSSEGVALPGGTKVIIDGAGNKVSGSGSGSGSTKPLTILDDPRYVLEKEKSKELDERYANVTQRMKDYLAAQGASNDLLADVAAIVNDKAKMAELNQRIQDSAIETALGVNAAVKAGKADYYDSMGGAIWGNSLGTYEKELEELQRQIGVAPPGFADSILSTIPKNVPMDYYIDAPLGLPGAPTEYWSSIPRYAIGTVDWRDEPYIADYQAGRYIPPAVLRRLQQAGLAGPQGQGQHWKPGDPVDGNAPPVPPPPAETTTYQPGYIPKNATLPSPIQQYDYNDWVDQATSAMARNISAGNSALPVEWGVTGLESWHGVPPSQMDASFLSRLRSIITAHKDDPAIIQAFGAAPTNATVYVPDPNAPPPKPTVTGKPTSTGVNPRANSGYYAPSSGGSSAYQYASAVGSVSDRERLALQERQLAIQEGLADAQIKLDRERFELEKIQDTRSAEYMEKEYQLRLTEQALNQQKFELDKVMSDLQKVIFEDSVHRWEVETGISRERLDLDKIAQEAQIEFQRGQLEIQRAAGILDQKQYEESVRQFDLQFNYQKSQDDRKLRLERAKTVAQLMANPADVMQQQFFYANMEDPVGTGYDVFTGAETGQKTWRQAYEEDAAMWEEATTPVNQMANGGFINDNIFMVGDQVKDKATGFEELIYNPTGAPIAVVNNELARALRYVPPKGKSYRGVA